ncbi:MAG TPA: histidine phosphatase family protein [Anaerolineales bacterium]|jgi:phosphohistidine phosphatase|nr:histidine phosphatase family protein [Anaerolineales bacterium]
MKTLLILRHAKSSWDDSSLPDHDRPLNRRGRQDAPRIGELIRTLDVVPDLIVSSTAVRARRTAELVGEHSGYTEQILLAGDLFHAAVEDYIAVLRTLPPEIDIAMIVGHNPDLEELLEDLTGALERMPTAALARIALPIADWSELNLGTKGELKGLWRPKELT